MIYVRIDMYASRIYYPVITAPDLILHFRLKFSKKSRVAIPVLQFQVQFDLIVSLTWNLKQVDPLG